MLLALDRSSVRTFDDDGHLHVSTANISKATVNPYLGREIPGFKELGLDADKVYKLLRDPKELEKAASSFTGKPLLIKHTPVGADDHPHDKVVGAVGAVKYEHPFLKAPLHVWPGEAIDLIKNGKQSQLSAGYRYTPRMEPGTYEGQHYDGRMTEISGNHLALVEEGRAGPQCVVGDSALNQTNDSMENLEMAHKPLTRKAALVLGGITAHFAPRFAQDKAIDFTPIVANITAKNYAERKTQLSGAVLKAVEGRLAMDADVETLVKLLDALQGAAPVEAKDDAEPVLDPNAAAAPKGGEMMEPETPPTDLNVAKDDEDGEMDASEDDASDGDGDAIAQARSFLASKLSPEDMNHFNSLVAKIGAEEAPTEDEEDPEAAMGDLDENANPPAGEKKPGDENKDDEMMPKSAMDAAIAARVKPAVAAAVAAVEAANKAKLQAKESVESALGKVTACDSATDYYRLGLKSFGVEDADTLPSVALKATFETLAKARKDAPRPKPAALAQDSAADADYAKRFPDAGRLAR